MERGADMLNRWYPHDGDNVLPFDDRVVVDLMIRKIGEPMHITLTDRETEILGALLHDYLPQLKREIARTEQRELRHLLVERQELIERLLVQITLP